MIQQYLDTDLSEYMKVDINREIFKFLLQAKTKATTISCQLKENQARFFHSRTALELLENWTH